MTPLPGMRLLVRTPGDVTVASTGSVGSMLRLP